MIFMLILFFMAQANSQSLYGLWEITRVQVGNETMTPVAKWTRIHEDGTYESGNGWLQNAEGTWVVDATNKTFTATQKNGLRDEFGGFEYSFSGKESMVWKRTEESMEVTVSLKRIKTLPQAPADKLVGVWILDPEHSKGTETRATSTPYFFFRWDRIYRERTEEGQIQTGYWHMHGHRPHITILPHTTGQKAQSWEVSFKNDQLILQGLSDDNKTVELRFNRSDIIP